MRRNVARCWTYETSVLLGLELADELPYPLPLPALHTHTVAHTHTHTQWHAHTQWHTHTHTHTPLAPSTRNTHTRITHTLLCVGAATL